MQNWHLIYTKPHKEELVCRQIEDRDIEVLWLSIMGKRQRGRPARKVSLFPQYVFVNVDLTSQEAADLQWLPGVRNFVHFEEQPAVIPESCVTFLRQRLAASEQKVSTGESPYSPGETIRVTSGPFKDLEAVFQQGINGHERVQIMLKTIGTWKRVVLNADQVAPVLL